jgi:formiminotetrahydrofolate cyclodeaminase
MPPEDDLLAASVHAFLDRVAAREPTPGGGSVAATAGALAVALARMVAAYSTGGAAAGPKAAQAGQAGERLAQAECMLRQLVNEDAAAYQAWRAARKSGDPAETARATALAIAVPLEIVGFATAALEVLNESKEAFNPRLSSDLGGAAVLAEACAQAAAYNVRINVWDAAAADPQHEVRDELDRLLAHARQARDALLAFVDAQI